jgi:hypothetical protein
MGAIIVAGGCERISCRCGESDFPCFHYSLLFAYLEYSTSKSVLLALFSLNMGNLFSAW